MTLRRDNADLIPAYVEDNYDALDTNTINKHIEYLTLTKRDVKFLLNVIETERKHPKTYLSHKPRNANSSYIKPDRPIDSKYENTFQP